jgi:hypothetical protein
VGRWRPVQRVGRFASFGARIRPIHYRRRDSAEELNPHPPACVDLVGRFWEGCLPVNAAAFGEADLARSRLEFAPTNGGLLHNEQQVVEPSVQAHRLHLPPVPEDPVQLRLFRGQGRTAPDVPSQGVAPAS